MKVEYLSLDIGIESPRLDFHVMIKIVVNEGAPKRASKRAFKEAPKRASKVVLGASRVIYRATSGVALGPFSISILIMT